MKIQAADSRHRLVAYVVLMVLVAGGLASTAVGEPTPPVSQAEASKRAEVGHQDTAPPEEPADSTRRALWAQGLVQTLPTDQRAGYWVDENNTVTLYVAGDADGARRQWQEEIDSSGFDVAVVRVTYSSEQLGAQLESSRWKDRGVPQEWLAGLMGVGLEYRENALELRVQFLGGQRNRLGAFPRGSRGHHRRGGANASPLRPFRGQSSAMGWYQNQALLARE
ncbi:hypothetical protein [Aestuariimicrobium kwangyangense]|uniref:hypothetical protein n=1 Tax=Aestuariimicrobium kwangyangense TaxID=396389 RepID=UPI0012FAB8D0|nr:hypothetical protein [Aestuariimicrobium kwangyangense]